MERLVRNRRELDANPKRRRWRPLATPLLLGLTRTVESAIHRHASGVGLDAGSGASPYRAALAQNCARIDTVDRERRGPRLTYEADLQAMPQVPTSSYETILCCEVLEHVENPEAALRELHRVLRPSGRLILSVPFLSRLHEEPHDYFRFTEYGLRELFRRSGFEVMEITPIGGVFSFIGHQVSSLLVLPTLHVPILAEAVLALNFLLVVLPSRALDRMSRSARKFPAGYVAVVRS